MSKLKKEPEKKLGAMTNLHDGGQKRARVGKKEGYLQETTEFG